MSEEIANAMKLSNEARVPLLIVVSDSHDQAREVAKKQGVLRGNAIVLSVPKSAQENLQQLNQMSGETACPRVHVFPPEANKARTSGNKPPCFSGDQFISLYTSRTTATAGQVHTDSQEVTSTLTNFATAASAWNAVQSKRKAATSSVSPVSTSSSVNQNSATAAASSTTFSATAASSMMSNEDSAPVLPEYRIVPKCNIRVHNNARFQPETLFRCAPQARDKTLPEIRRVIAEAAADTFGNNFLFVEGDSAVRVNQSNERYHVAKDICAGSTLYISPSGPAAEGPALPSLTMGVSSMSGSGMVGSTSGTNLSSPPASSSSSSATAAAASGSGSGSSDSLNEKQPVQQQQQTSSSSATSSASSSPSTTTASSSSSQPQIRMKITYPNGDDEVVKFPLDAKAEEIKKHIHDKLGHSNFFMQLAQRRIRDEELTKSLSDLNIRGAVAIRVYDVDAMRERADQYEKERQQSPEQPEPSGGGGMFGGITSMLSSAASKLTGSNNNPSSSSGGNNSSSSSSSSAPPPKKAPTSMAEMRRIEEEEAERRKKEKKGKPTNTFFNGGESSGTSTMAPDNNNNNNNNNNSSSNNNPSSSSSQGGGGNTLNSSQKKKPASNENNDDEDDAKKY